MTAAFDVVVIGAGLAGLWASRAAARAGLSVLLVDRKRRIDAQVHTTGIFVRRTLEDFALPEDCLGPPVRRVRLLAPSLTGIALTSAKDEFRVGRMGRLYARLLDDAARSGVETRLGTTYEGGTPDGSSTLVRLGAGRRVEHVTARFLIAADGAVSRVAADLGLDANREWIVGVEDVYAAGDDRATPELTCVVDPRLAPGYIAWIVSDGEQVHIGVGGYADRFDPKAALATFTSRAARIVSSRGPRLERRGGLIPVGGVLRRIANDRGALVGDAAGAPSPLTAGGLDPCLRLSEAVASACCRRLAGDPAAIASIDGARFRARFGTRLLMRRALSAIRHRVVAESLLLALRPPPVRALAAKVFFGDGSFPDSAPLAVAPVASLPVPFQRRP